MARKQPKRWVYSPLKPPKPVVPDTVKAKVEAKAKVLIKKVLKPRHVRPQEGSQFYLKDFAR